MTQVVNIDSFFRKLISKDELTNDIELYYGRAVDSLLIEIKRTRGLLKKEEFLSAVKTSLMNAKKLINNGQFIDYDFRSQLIDDFEVEVNSVFNIETASNSRLIWNGEKEVLAEIFMRLKMSYNKNGKPYLSVTIDSLAHFLKANFEAYEKTAITTIQKTLNDRSNAIANNNGKVKIDISK